jgi:hypothetical protein
MGLPVINTREDLDAIVGTPDHDVFMAYLQGSIYLLRRDELNKTWIAKEDKSTIERFRFSISDFPEAAPPELPAWVDQPDMTT